MLIKSDKNQTIRLEAKERQSIIPLVEKKQFGSNSNINKTIQNKYNYRQSIYNSYESILMTGRNKKLITHIRYKRNTQWDLCQQ